MNSRLNNSIHFVFLAAGQSKRMGEPKSLLKFGDSTWIQHQVNEVQKMDSGIEVSIVVNRDLYPIMQKIDFGSRSESIKIVENSLENSEPWQSLLLALSSAPARLTFVTPVDVPQESNVVRAMSDSWKFDPSADAIIPRYLEKSGHPVLLTSKAMSEFLLRPERLDIYLRGLKVRFLPVRSPSICRNLNTPELWQDFISEERQSITR
jgi:molybdenum cofactor cytidylyltransferase